MPPEMLQLLALKALFRIVDSCLGLILVCPAEDFRSEFTLRGYSLFRQGKRCQLDVLAVELLLACVFVFRLGKEPPQILITVHEKSSQDSPAATRPVLFTVAPKSGAVWSFCVLIRNLLAHCRYRTEQQHHFITLSVLQHVRRAAKVLGCWPEQKDHWLGSRTDIRLGSGWIRKSGQGSFGWPSIPCALGGFWAFLNEESLSAPLSLGSSGDEVEIRPLAC